MPRQLQKYNCRGIFLALDIVAMERMKYQWGDQFGWLIGIKKGTA